MLYHFNTFTLLTDVRNNIQWRNRR